MRLKVCTAIMSMIMKSRYENQNNFTYSCNEKILGICLFKQWNEKYDEMSLVSVIHLGRTIAMTQSECQKPSYYSCFVWRLKLDTLGANRRLVKGEESQYSLTEALCLFWAPPWGLQLSPVTNIHIIDRVLYCRMTFLSPIIENWL